MQNLFLLYKNKLVDSPDIQMLMHFHVGSDLEKRAFIEIYVGAKECN